MLNYFKNRARQKNRTHLLAEITRLNPELAEFEGEAKINQYIMQGLDAFVDLEKAYAQTSPEKLAELGFVPELRMPDLLREAIQYWAKDSALVYAIILLKGEIENIRLRKTVAYYESISELHQKQEDIVNDMADLANKTIEDVNKAVSIERRQN